MEEAFQGEFTFANITSQLQTENFEAGWQNEHFPVIEFCFEHFAPLLNLISDEEAQDFEPIAGFRNWFKSTSYADKKRLFEDLGFKVECLYARYDKFHDFIKFQSKLDQKFVDKKINLFAVKIDASSFMYGSQDSIVFGLSFPLNTYPKPLAEYTVDYNEIAEEKRFANQMSQLFASTPDPDENLFK